MSVDKAEIKILTAQSLVVQLDSDLKNAEALIAESKGGERAMIGVMKALASVMAAAKEDLDSENLSIDDIKVVRRYIARMQQSVTDVAKQQESSRLIAEGVARGIGQARLRIQTMEKAERAKLITDNEPSDSKKPTTRRTGKRPETPEHTTRDKPPAKKKRGRPRKVKVDNGRAHT